MKKEEKTPFDLEELANALTHGVGACFSLAGLIFLILQSVWHADALHLTCVIIYGVSLTFLYTISTLYHSFKKASLKRTFRILDHCAIYLLIAGSYTPFAALLIKGTMGITLLVIVWTMALFGIIFKIFFTGKMELLSNILYLSMGWISIIAIKPMLENMPFASLVLLFAGGASYSLGIIFYLWDRLPFNHTIWHLFVLGGSACHYLSISSSLFPSLFY
ncbi:Hemolysin-3 [Chlamydiales bacterium SCGC AB-751-O23]|jgi:hemolysin III|nr:Hemolysin-3 [Chlamydiales bacterium SCGC AB-751-O23]